MGLRAIDPIDPIEICKHFDLVLLKLSELECDVSHFLGAGQSVFSAVTVPCGSQTAIVHNDAHHLYRQRSNIAHELAHCFLGHETSPPLNDAGERIRDGSIEAEANFLSGTLLIPNEAAVHIVKNGLVHRAPTIYGVSQKMLEFRLRMSGAYTIHARSIQAVGSIR
jgi:hypothetical protein